MNATTLDKVALRYRALFLDIDRDGIDMKSAQSPSAMAFATSLHQIGFYASEELLHAISMVNAERLADITKTMNRVMGVDLNWAPLVKGWNVPTGETPCRPLHNMDSKHLCWQIIHRRHTAAMWTHHSRRNVSTRTLQRLPVLRHSVCYFRRCLKGSFLLSRISLQYHRRIAVLTSLFGMGRGVLTATKTTIFLLFYISLILLSLTNFMILL